MVAMWVEPESLSCEASPEALAAGAAIASEVLYHLTGRRWPGVVADVVRRDDQGCYRASSWWGWTSWDSTGDIAGWRSSWRPWLVHPTSRGLLLPGFPVLSVVSVTVDGVLVPAVEYHVEDRRVLVLDESQGPGALEVEYLWGGGPGPAGEAAAASYACQIAKSMTPDCRDCRLPRRVTTITRQGVSAAVLDPMTLAQDGLTGLAEVDTWVTAVLLGDRRRRGQVIVPGAASRVRYRPI